MKNVSIFTPEMRVLCELSFAEPSWNFTQRLKEKEKAREALKSREETLFVSSPDDCSAGASVPGSLRQRSGVSCM